MRVLIILIATGFTACGSSGGKKKKANKSTQNRVATNPVVINATDPNCGTNDMARVFPGENGMMNLNLQNFADGTHQLGFHVENESLRSQVMVNPKQVVLNRPTLGSHRVNVVVRNMNACMAANNGNRAACESQSGFMLARNSAYDVEKSLSFVVSQPAGSHANIGELGQGGGFFGDLITGQGFAGVLGQVFGGMMGGGNSGGGGIGSILGGLGGGGNSGSGGGLGSILGGLGNAQNQNQEQLTPQQAQMFQRCGTTSVANRNNGTVSNEQTNSGTQENGANQ